MTRAVAGLVLVALTTARSLAAADRVECSQLASLIDVKVTEAVAVPASTTGPITVAHCRVAGVIGTEITDDAENLVCRQP